MAETLQSLGHKIAVAGDLNTVVRTMKALSAANINQYEKSVLALQDFYRNIQLGLHVCVIQKKMTVSFQPPTSGKTAAVIFGSGQGLVGQYNDMLIHYAAGYLDRIPGEKYILTVGNSINTRLIDQGLEPVHSYEVPLTLDNIPQLVAKLLLAIESQIEADVISQCLLFYQQPNSSTTHSPFCHRFYPWDEKWIKELSILKWPSEKIPELISNERLTLKALIRAYYYVSLFRASVEALASEYASRLAAMQRAEKNIEEMLDQLTIQYHQFRQQSIDEEMFDVIAGSEAINKEEE